MKQFLNTLCVYVGNILHDKVSTWEAAKAQAEEMEKAYQQYQANPIDDNLTDNEGKPIKAKGPMSSLMYLLDGLLNICLGIFFIWAVIQLVNAFFAILPYIILVVVVTFIIQQVSPPKTA